MNLANRITMTRIVLSPVMIAALLYYSPERSYLYAVAVICFVVACITDALDGYLARRMNEKTTLGAYIDPVADKLLLLSGFSSLSLMTHLPSQMHVPAWATLVIISRDALILIGSMIIFLTSGKLHPEPIFLGKVTTVVQMAALFSALLMTPEPVKYSLMAAAVVFSVWSGVLYVQMGGRMLQNS